VIPVVIERSLRSIDGKPLARGAAYQDIDIRFTQARFLVDSVRRESFDGIGEKLGLAVIKPVRVSLLAVDVVRECDVELCLLESSANIVPAKCRSGGRAVRRQ
jgi:hypothetical protein